MTMSDKLASDNSDESSGAYRRSRLTELLDRLDELSDADVVKACAAILAIALLRGDTALAFEALIRNGCRSEDRKRFLKVVASRGFSEVGSPLLPVEKSKGKTEDVATTVQSLKTELKSLAVHHDPSLRLARLPLLCRIESDEFEVVFKYLTLLELPHKSGFPKSSAAGYTWYLRGSLASEGRNFTMSAGALLNDDAISTLVGGEDGCVCLHLPFAGNDLIQSLSNFGLLSAEVEWSRMIWKALQTVHSFDELGAEHLLDAVDAARLMRDSSGAKDLQADQRWRVLSIKKPQTGIRSFASLGSEELGPLCPALLWTEAAWEQLVSQR